MRILKFSMTGNIGVYHGMFKDHIDIDFSNCRSNICLISGRNGTGKSSILKSLSLLPDTNDTLIPGMECSKYIELTDGINLYQILFIYPLMKNGTRGTTKVSIKKNGIELNENNLVNNYKSIIIEEFDLDPNYFTLASISSDNRGLADKTPGERKALISSRMRELAEFNGMYKALSKKANDTKNYIKAVTTKINNIGNEDAIRSQYSSIQSRIEILEKDIETIKSEISKNEGVLYINGIDPRMLKDFNAIEDKADKLKDAMEVARKELQHNIYQSHQYDFGGENIENHLKHIQSMIDETYQKIADLTVTNVYASNEHKKLLSDEVRLDKEIEELKLKINSLSSNIDEELTNQIAIYAAKVKKVEIEAEKAGINLSISSKDEIHTMLNTVSDICEYIKVLQEDYTESEKELIISCLNTNETVSDKMSDKIAHVQQDITNAENTIESERDKLSELIQDQKNINLLNKIPDQCKFHDSCIFLTATAEILKKFNCNEKEIFSFLENKINTSRSIIRDLDVKLHEYHDILNKFHDMTTTMLRLREIRNTINRNHEILAKYRISNRLLEDHWLENAFMNIYSLNEFNQIEPYLEVANDIVTYISDKEIFDRLKSRLEIQTVNSNLIDSYKDEITKKQKEIEEIEKDLVSITSTEKKSELTLKSLRENIEILKKIDKSIKKFEDTKKTFEEQDKLRQEISAKSSTNLKLLEINNLNRATLNEKEEHLKPLKKSLDTLKTQLDLLESFKAEYNQYSNDYMILNKLRNYASPTQGSIQSLFMSMYMDKTLDDCNTLLSMIFDNQYRLLPYIINENEFRIPFVGYGMQVDDISNGSTSQKSIMGMIINLVMLYGASGGGNKYNIASLDEIDGGLDNKNRYMFVEILNMICRSLNMEQLFIISHSAETALQNVDVVLLSNEQEYLDQFANANIIYINK